MPRSGPAGSAAQRPCRICRAAALPDLPRSGSKRVTELRSANLSVGLLTAYASPSLCARDRRGLSPALNGHERSQPLRSTH